MPDSIIWISRIIGDEQIGDSFDSRACLEDVWQMPTQLCIKRSDNRIRGISATYPGNRKWQVGDCSGNCDSFSYSNDNPLLAVNCVYDCCQQFITGFSPVPPNEEQRDVLKKKNCEIVGFKGTYLAGQGITSLQVYFRPLYLTTLYSVMTCVRRFERDPGTAFREEVKRQVDFFHTKYRSPEELFEFLYINPELPDSVVTAEAILLFCSDYFSRIGVSMGFDVPGGYLAVGKNRFYKSRKVLGEYPFQNVRGIALSDKEKLDTYQAMEKAQGFDGLMERESVPISCCYFDDNIVFVERPGTRVPLHYDCSGFDLTGTKGKDSEPEKEKEFVNREIARAVREAVEAGAEILLFPEMLMDNADVATLIANLNLGSGALKLVLAGSIHRKESERWVNRTPILYKDNANIWNELTHYDKKIPLSLLMYDSGAEKKHCRENIEFCPEVTLLRAKGGFIGVAICRDVLDLINPHNPIARYADFVDLLLVVSYSAGATNLFVSAAESLARWHHCAVGCVNASSAIHGDNQKYSELALVLYPQVRSSSVELIGAVSGNILYKALPFKQEVINRGGEMPPGKLGILHNSGITFSAVEAGSILKTYSVFFEAPLMSDC